MSGQEDAIVGGSRGAFDAASYRHPTRPLVAVWIASAALGGPDRWEIWDSETYEAVHAFPEWSLIDNGEWAMAAYLAIEELDRLIEEGEALVRNAEAGS